MKAKIGALEVTFTKQSVCENKGAHKKERTGRSVIISSN